MLKIGRSAAAGAGLLMAVSLTWLAGIGCGSSGKTPPHKTYPVSGKVFYKGGRLLTDGVVQFQSKSDPSLTTKGDIQPDGTFELVTLFEQEQLPGAREGQFQVTVIPRMSDNKPVEISQLPRLFTVGAKENYFSIELERPKDRPPR